MVNDSRPIARAGSLYFALIFALGFVLGAVRTLLVAPRYGEPLAVLIELPVMLTASWFVCGWVLRRVPVQASPGPRLAMGAVAFALLMLAEITLSMTAFDRSLAGYFRELTTPHGLIGLAGQLAFALVPLFYRPR